MVLPNFLTWYLITAHKTEAASKDLCGRLTFIAFRDRINVLKYFGFPFLSTPARSLEINAQWATEVLKLLQTWTAGINRLVHYIELTVCKYAIFSFCKGSCSSVASSHCRVQGPDFRATYLDCELPPFIHAPAFKLWWWPCQRQQWFGLWLWR